MTFELRRVQWLQLIGEAGKCTSYWCKNFLGTSRTEVIKYRLTFDRVAMKKMQRWPF